MDRGFELNNIIKGLRFAIILSLLISAALILYTMDSNALKKAVQGINPTIILLLFSALLANWFFAGLRLKILVNTIGGQLTIKDSILIYLSGAFVSNVTPFASGGGPFQVYFLHKKGVNIGKASTVIVTQFVFRTVFFAVASCIFFIFFNRVISPGVIPLYLFYLTFGLGFIFAVLLLIFMVVPSVTDRFIKLTFRINKIKQFVKNNLKAKKFLVKARRELREFHLSLELLVQYKKKLVLVGIITILYWSSIFIIIPLALIGLNLEPHFLQSYVMQTIFYLVIPFMPTPGASGIAEVGFASLFVSFVPGSLIGLVTFIWRFFTFYMILLVGGIFALREIGRNRGSEA